MCNTQSCVTLAAALAGGGRQPRQTYAGAEDRRAEQRAQPAVDKTVQPNCQELPERPRHQRRTEGAFGFDGRRHGTWQGGGGVAVTQEIITESVRLRHREPLKVLNVDLQQIVQNKIDQLVSM